jgi:thiopeptide-type bacteriocin biosynthesis protein
MISFPDYKIPYLILRCPSLPFSELKKIATLESLDMVIRALIKDSRFSESIFNSSPSLHSKLTSFDKLKDKERSRVMLSTMKYFLRMASRSTPFGLFSGCGVVDISNVIPGKAHFEIDMSNQHIHRRMDMGFVYSIYNFLKNKPLFLKTLSYKSNETLRKVKDKWRFYKRSEDNNDSQIEIAIQDTEILSNIIEKTSSDWKSFSDLVKILLDLDFDLEESENFLLSIIDSGILINDHFPNLTVQEYENRLLKRLKELPSNSDSEIDQLFQAFSQISRFLEEGNPILPEQYERFITKLDEIGFPYSKDNLFQMNLVNKISSASLPNNLFDNLKSAINIINDLNQSDRKTRLEILKEKFIAKYGDRKISILELLSSEIGELYKEEGTFEEHDRTTSLSQSMRLKHSLFIEALKNNTGVIELQSNLEPVKPIDLPDSFYLFGSLVSDGGDTKILFYHIGSPALKLISRFSFSSNDIHNFALETLETEEILRPNKVLAEISHLPSGRSGNLLSRSATRRYEIVFHGNSVLDNQFQINVNDLMIYQIEGNLILYSKKLQREILPILTSGHNHNAPGTHFIYKFLCDFQHQNFSDGFLYWDWGFLKRESFLPRVTYKNLIISSAKWNVPKNEVNKLKNLSVSVFKEQFAALSNTIKLPSRFFLQEGDNTLPINTKEETGLILLKSIVDKYDHLTFQECIFNEENLLINDGKDNFFTNEVIFPFIKAKSNSIPLRTSVIERNIKSIYSPFDEWIFLKIYTQHNYCDEIICSNISMLINDLIQLDLIDKWFFIRYADPNHHIRLRIHQKSQIDLNQIMRSIKNNINILIKDGLVSDIIYDSYRPEIERYGLEKITNSEEYFSRDSELVIKLIREVFTQSALEENPAIMHLACVYYLHKLLHIFHGNEEDVLSTVINAKNGFYSEFLGRMTEAGIKEVLKSNYRATFKSIDMMFKEKDSNQIIYSIVKQLDVHFENSSNLLKDVKLYLISKDGSNKQLQLFISSIFHMFINRLFSIDQRFQEFLVYDSYFKYNQSSFKRSLTTKNLNDSKV